MADFTIGEENGKDDLRRERTEERKVEGTKKKEGREGEEKRREDREERRGGMGRW